VNLCLSDSKIQVSDAFMSMFRPSCPVPLQSMVANLTAGLPRCEPATLPGGAEAVLKPGRYLVDFQSRLEADPKGTASPHQQSKMELLHTLTKNADNAKVCRCRLILSALLTCLRSTHWNHLWSHSPLAHYPTAEAGIYGD
jgi:hypothetical protein